MIEPGESMASDEPVGATPSLYDSVAARRRAAFWRRLFGILLGLLLVLGVVVWQRANSLAAQCRNALHAYADAATAQGLAARPPSLIAAEWANMDTLENLPARHYHVIAPNWLVAPAPGQAVPLAVCRDPHSRLLESGRHVLFQTEDGPEVRWIDEEHAGRLAEAAGNP